LSTKDFDRNQAEKYLGNNAKKIFVANERGKWEGESGINKTSIMKQEKWEVDVTI